MKTFKKLLLFLTIFLISQWADPNNVKAQILQNTTEYQYSKALYLKSQGKIMESINILNKLVPQKGISLERINYQIADSYFKLINFKNALKYSQKAIDVNPKFADPYILMFKTYNILKQYKLSADTLYKLLENNSESIYYHYLLARLYTETLRNYNMGSYIYLKLLERSQNSHVPLYYIEQSNYSLFGIFMKTKQYDKAIHHLNQAININSKYKQNLLQIADFFTKKNLTHESVICLKSYLKFTPSRNNLKPLFKKINAYLGRYYYISESHQAYAYLRISIDLKTIAGQLSYALFNELIKNDKIAKSELLKVIKKMPKAVSANIALARIYKREKNIDSAYKHYYDAATVLYKTNMYNACRWSLYNAILLKPDQSKLHYSLAELYEKNHQLKAAIYHYKEFYNTQKEKKDIEILLHIAYLYSLADDNNRSQKYFIEAHKIKSDYARAYFFQGLIATRENNYPNAENFFAKAVKLKTDRPSYYFYLALSQEKQNKIDQAITNLQNALKLDKDNASYANYLGYLYTEKNINIDEASELIIRALKKDPYNGAYLDSLGWVYYRQGKYKKALLHLERAERNLLASQTPDSAVFDHIAETYYKLGKKDLAIKYWEKALNLKKDDKIIKKINEAQKSLNTK